MKPPEPTLDTKKILLETDLPDRAKALAVRDALLLHKRLGAPIAVWKDGAVVWIPAEEIEIPPEDELQQQGCAAEAQRLSAPAAP